MQKSADSAPVVRKTASSTDYNRRLILQMEKQECFSSNRAKAPRVVRSGYTDNGLFYFDMEYIEGYSLAEYIKRKPVEDALSIVNRLMEFDKSASQDVSCEVSTIRNKISSLEQTLHQYGDSSPCKKAVTFLKSFPFIVHPFKCHGDLTFENVIITPEREVYLIDFLDSFVDCYEIDISKLMQDAFCKWSYRSKLPDETTKNKLKTISAVIEDVYKKNTNSISSEQLYAMLLLTLLRIYPYAKDSATIEFLNRETLKVLERVNFNEQ